MTNKKFPQIIIYLALIFGWGSLLLFGIFLYVGSFSLWNAGLTETKLLAVDAGLSLLFFIQHSAMLRKSFRRQASLFIPKHYYAAFYAIVSGIALFIPMILWQKSAISVMEATGYFRWLFRILFVLSITGFIWGIRALGAFDPFGIKSIVNHLKNREPKIMPLAIRGPYRFVRHPLYFFMLLMIWSCPDLTADRLLFNVLWTLWVIVGTLLEERDLVHEFGEAYQNYQKKIPMLLPLKIFSRHS